MEPAFRASDLPACRIVIAGLGLMGGSLAMALRGKCQALWGIDPDPATRDMAVNWGIVDEAGAEAGEILAQADLLILAAPVQAILEWLEILPGLIPGELMVLDLGSTKMEITRAMETLPSRFDTLGGHPMCGKEKSTLAHAEATLFQGAQFAFTPLARTSWKLRRLAEDIARVVGAMPLWIDPQTHDAWAAFTSHLPFLMANALAYITPQETRPLIGPGFRSTTRLAGSSLAMMTGILTTNRENVLASLSRLQDHLAVLETCLQDEDWLELMSYLAAGAERRAAVIE